MADHDDAASLNEAARTYRFEHGCPEITLEARHLSWVQGWPAIIPLQKSPADYPADSTITFVPITSDQKRSRFLRRSSKLKTHRSSG